MSASYYVIKIAVTTALVIAISELSKRSTLPLHGRHRRWVGPGYVTRAPAGQTSSPIDRISSTALLFVTGPSRSVKSNFICP